nr:hypothetical protein [Pseudomonas botevensis]
MAVNDVITVTFTGATGTPAGGSHTAAPKTVAVLGEQEIALANSPLAFNLGKGVTVSYTVKQGNAAPIPSPSRPLVVAPLTLGPTYASKILQAANNGDGPELDVSAITTTVRTHSPNWPLIALKQYVWLRFRGTQSSGAAYDKFIFQPPGSVTNPGWVTSDYEYNVPAAVVNEIKGLKHGSSFTVEFKAGLSGTQQEADAVTFPVRTYTIKAVEDLKPAITRAEDSRGTEIAPGGITADPVVKLTGTAAKDQKLEVFDGTTSKGQATANASGLWELRMTALSVAAHTFRARALYGSNLESEARTLTVTALIAPTLVNVLDAAGTPVPEGGVTTSTTLKLSGKASNGQRVEIFDGNGSGAVSKGIATAHATTGDWEHTITVAAGARRLYAKSLYHSSDTYSDVRNLSVVAATAPTITSVKGLPSNVEIPNGGTIIETAVLLTGSAAQSQKVEVFDGTTSKGEATANATSGVWTLNVSPLSQGLHSFKAKALYDPGVESDPRTLTVVALIDPTITSIKDNWGTEILNNALTKATTLAFTGKATANMTVELRDKGVVIVPLINVGSTGEWTHTLSNPTRGTHSYTVKAKYGNSPESSVRSLTVINLTTGIESFPASTSFELRRIGDIYTSVSGLEFTLTTQVEANLGVMANRTTIDNKLYNYHSTARIKLINGYAQSLSIWYLPGEGSQVFRITFFDLNNKDIYSEVITNKHQPAQYNFSAPADSEISYFDIHDQTSIGACFITQFQWG